MKILVGQSLRIGVYQCVSSPAGQPIKPIDSAETEQIRVRFFEPNPCRGFQPAAALRASSIVHERSG
jgi:hypothetical protein